LRSPEAKARKLRSRYFDQNPKGIEVTFSPEKGNFDVTKVIIKSSNAVPGQYSLIVNATLNGKTKGSIIKLSVSDKVIASDGKQ
jgi:hypothetical protein